MSRNCGGVAIAMPRLVDAQPHRTFVEGGSWIGGTHQTNRSAGTPQGSTESWAMRRGLGKRPNKFNAVCIAA
jgi:hypothetical protein